MTITHRNRLRCHITNNPGLTGDLIIGRPASITSLLGESLTGYRSFTAADDGLIFEPTFDDGLYWEIRTGCVYTHATSTLTRGTLVDSSTGSAIALTSAAIVGLHGTAKAMQDLEPQRVVPSTTTTTQLQAIINAVSTAGGGVVTLGAGVFTCSNTLLVKTGVQLRGSGRGVTILRGATGDYAGVTVNSAAVYATVAMVDVSDASVSSLTVDHLTNACTNNGIVAIAGGATGAGTGCDRCTIQDCQVIGYDSHQYLIWQRRGRNINILYNHVDGSVPTYTPASEQEGIECYGGVSILVQGNNVKAVGNNGAYINPDASVSGSAIDVRYVDNYFEACKVGVYLLPSTDVKNIQISGNHIYNSWVAGIKCATSSTIAVDGLTISGNLIRTAPIGIAVQGALTNVYSRLLVANNSISTVGLGIYIYQVGPGSIIGNSIKNSTTHGIQTDYANSLSVSENNIDTVTLHGLYATNMTGGTLCNNRVLNYAGGGSSYGARIDSCTNLIVDGNYFSWVSLGYAAYATGAGSVALGLNNKTAASYGGNPVYRNDATNPNFGTFTLTAVSTTKTITNSLVQNSSMVHVQQTGGTLRSFSLAQGTGAFTMTFAAAVGDETFKYVIW